MLPPEVSSFCSRFSLLDERDNHLPHIGETMSIILYWYWTTNPQKIRLALEELGLSYSLKEMNLMSGEHNSDEYKKIHPRSKVPALQIDGDVLWESGAALMYLAKRENRLWPTNDVDALNFLFLESAIFQKLAGVHFYQKKIKPLLGKKTNWKAISETNHKLEPLLAMLRDQLQDQEYICGTFSVVDCAFAPWLPVLDLDRWPILEQWKERLMQRPSWEACNFQY